MSNSTPTEVRSQPQLDELRRGAGPCWLLLVGDWGPAVHDRAGAGGLEVARPIGGISERDCPQASPPVQGSRFGGLEGVAGSAPLIACIAGITADPRAQSRDSTEQRDAGCQDPTRSTRQYRQPPLKLWKWAGSVVDSSVGTKARWPPQQ